MGLDVVADRGGGDPTFRQAELAERRLGELLSSAPLPGGCCVPGSPIFAVHHLSSSPLLSAVIRALLSRSAALSCRA
jgi:hypothetical protein